MYSVSAPGVVERIINVGYEYYYQFVKQECLWYGCIFLAWEYFGRMFDHSFPACAIFFLSFFKKWR